MFISVIVSSMVTLFAYFFLLTILTKDRRALDGYKDFCGYLHQKVLFLMLFSVLFILITIFFISFSVILLSNFRIEVRFRKKKTQKDHDHTGLEISDEVECSNDDVFDIPVDQLGFNSMAKNIVKVLQKEIHDGNNTIRRDVSRSTRVKHATMSEVTNKSEAEEEEKEEEAEERRYTIQAIVRNGSRLQLTSTVY